MFCLGDKNGPEQLHENTTKWMKQPGTDLSFVAMLIISVAIKNTYAR